MGAIGRGTSGAGRTTPPQETTSKEVEYKKFDSKARTGYYFKDDGGETAKFFEEHSNARELIDNLGIGEPAAFIGWTEGDFMLGQQYKPHFFLMSERDQGRTRIFDKILDQATLDTPIQVRRLSNAQFLTDGKESTLSLEQIQAMEGREIVCKGNLSTAAAAEGLRIGSGVGSSARNIEYVINVPSGTGYGMWLGTNGVRKINAWKDKQREFMMNRDLVYKVGKSRQVKRKGVTITEVEITVIARAKHSYD